jgi:hypothetical protein
MNVYERIKRSVVKFRSVGVIDPDFNAKRSWSQKLIPDVRCPGILNMSANWMARFWINHVPGHEIMFVRKIIMAGGLLRAAQRWQTGSCDPSDSPLFDFTFLFHDMILKILHLYVSLDYIAILQ